jgi:hypothetical protein
MSRTLAFLALTLLGCPGTEVITTDLTDRGTACIDDNEVLVDFNTCLSSSCDTLLDEVCSATLEGTTLVVTASGTIETLTGKNVACTDDCGFAQVRCDLPEGWEAATTLSYGGETQAVDAACDTF